MVITDLHPHAVRFVGGPFVDNHHIAIDPSKHVIKIAESLDFMGAMLGKVRNPFASRFGSYVRAKSCIRTYYWQGWDHA